MAFMRTYRYSCLMSSLQAENKAMDIKLKHARYNTTSVLNASNIVYNNTIMLINMAEVEVRSGVN